MTPEIKSSLWSYLRGSLIGFSLGLLITTQYWFYRVHDIAKKQQSVERQLDSVKRACEGQPPMRAVSLRQPKIIVQLFGDETSTMPTIMVSDPKGADRMVVVTQYWTDLAGSGSKILLTRTSVLPPVTNGILIASDPVPVPKNMVRMVEVTLVKDLDFQSFEFQMEKP